MFKKFAVNTCALVMCVSFVAACAKKSDNIPPAYISPLIYQDYSCEQLSAEATRVSQRSAQISGVQDKQAGKDALAVGVGVILFPVALLFVKGGGATEGEVARLKGEVEAIERASIEKECGISFNRGEQQVPVQPQPQPS